MQMGNGVCGEEAKTGLAYGGVEPPSGQSSRGDDKEDEKHMQKYVKARTEAFESARRLVETREGRPDLFLPLVIPLDELDEMIGRVSPPLHKLLPEYIKDRFGNGSSQCKILLELCISRRLVILMDGIDETALHKSDIVKYFLSTLVEDNYPLVILTSTAGYATHSILTILTSTAGHDTSYSILTILVHYAGVMPIDIRDEGIKAIFISPLTTEKQHSVLKMLCEGHIDDGRFDQAKDMLSKPPFDTMGGNPLLLSQYMHLLKCGPDAMRDIKKNGLTSSLQELGLRQLLAPLNGVDATYLDAMKEFAQKNGLQIPFAVYEEDIRSELEFLKTDDNIELIFRVSYDTHQRTCRSFVLGDIQAVATEAQRKGGLPEILCKLAWLGRLPIFETKMLNSMTPSLKMPHISLQLHAAAKFTEMEFRATIEAFTAKQKSKGGSNKKDQVEDDSELQELVKLIFTLEGREPYSALRNTWWQPVFDTFMKTIPKDVSHPVLRVVVQSTPVEATAALTRAVEAGDRLRARLLLTANVEVDHSFTRPDPRDGTLPLHHLCGAKLPQLSLIRVMLDVYRDGIRVRDREGLLPLHWACSSSSPHHDLIMLLLEYYKGAASEHDERGRVPFHCLAQNATVSPTTIVAVLKAWPVLHIQDNSGLMALHLACKAKKAQSHFIMSLLEDPKCGESVRHPVPETGELPLHLLCASPCVTLAMLRLIVNLYPEACEHLDKAGRRPLDMLLTQDVPSPRMVNVLLEQFIAPDEGGESTLVLDSKVMLNGLFRFLFTHPKPTKEITLALMKPLMQVKGLENLMKIVEERVLVLRLPSTIVRSDITVDLLQSVPPALMKGGGGEGGGEEETGISTWVCNTNAPSEHTVQTMLKVDKNGVKRPDKDGMLPLHWACKATTPNEGAIKALLDAHAPAAEVMTAEGKLPLHYLCENKKCTENMLKLLLRAYKGGAMDYDKSTGFLPLQAAISSPRAHKKVWLKSISLLMKAYPGAVEETDQHNGMLALHMACKRPAPSVALVSQLLEMYPIAVTLPDMKKGCLPLHWMMRSSSKKKRMSEKVVKMLLKHHPDAARDFDDGAGRLPLHYICVLEGSSAELCKVMVGAFPQGVEMGDELAGRLPIHWACKNPNGRLSRELVKILVEKFPQALRQADSVGMIPIHYACSAPNPSVDTVKAMLASERNAANQGQTEESIALIPDKQSG
jgi:ankyrin repeat protein